MATARPGIRALDLAEVLKVSENGPSFRDLAELQRLGFPVTFGNGYPAQQEALQAAPAQEMAQILADLVDQQLEVVRRSCRPRKPPSGERGDPVPTDGSRGGSHARPRQSRPEI